MFFNLLIVIIYLTIYLNFVFGIIFAPSVIIYYFFPKYKFCINILKNIIWSSVSFITHILLFANIYVNSNEYIEEIGEIGEIGVIGSNKSNKSNIIISNHIFELDFLIHNIIISNTSINSINNGLAKKFVGFQLPITGFFGLLTGDIFLHRKIELDIGKLNTKKNFNNILIFPEGTCYTKEKKIISDIYCDKNKLIKFNYHLYPRITGLKTIVQSNPNTKHIYDTTIIYDKITPDKYGNHYNTLSYLYNLYSFPNKVFIKINKYKISVNNFEKQIEHIFWKKDKFIEEFDLNSNKFIPIKFNYIKGFGCFIITNFLSMISILLFVKFSFFKYMYFIEFVMYYIYFFFFV